MPQRGERQEVTPRTRGRKKKDEVPAEWARREEIEKLVAEVAKKFHKHLERAVIAVLGKPKAGKRMGRRVIATVHKPTAMMNAMLADEWGELHYIIVVGMDAWGELDQKAKRRVIDEALCHFTGMDEKDRWQIVDYDVKVFHSHFKRWGAYNADVEMFVEAARQIDMFPEDAQTRDEEVPS